LWFWNSGSLSPGEEFYKKSLQKGEYCSIMKKRRRKEPLEGGNFLNYYLQVAWPGGFFF
jgi:hypothetical protein